MANYYQEYLKLKRQQDMQNNGIVTPEKWKEIVEWQRTHDSQVAAMRDEYNARKLAEKKKQEEEKEDGLSFVDSGAFGDEKGNFFTDLADTIGGTMVDFVMSPVKGLLNTAEGIVDLAAYGVGGVADLLGADDFAEGARDVARFEAINKAYEGLGINDVIENSVFGDTSRAILEGVGQVGAMIASGGAASAAGVSATAVTTGTMFASSAGQGISEAYKGGATDGEATAYGLTKGVIDAGTEMMFGGLGKGVNAIGYNKGLLGVDDMLATAAGKAFKSKVGKTVAQMGIKATAEGVEELAAGYLSAHAKKGTYQSEEEFEKILNDEKLLEQFIVGAAVGGIAQTGSGVQSIQSGRDMISGHTENEQSVLDMEIENRIKVAEKEGTELSKKDKKKIHEDAKRDLERGFISIDTIESTLSPMTYDRYKKVVDNETKLEKEISELENLRKEEITVKQSERLQEARQELKELRAKDEKSSLKSMLNDEVRKATENDAYLAESYNERARRGKKFEANVEEYEEAQRETIQKAIDSGVLNNSNKTHAFVDLMAKLAADKGIKIDFANNKKIQESGFAVEGKTINGYVKGDNIVLNVSSDTAIRKVVGHEITHILEGTEMYAELQQAVKQYAETRGEYEARLQEIQSNYQNVENANIENELTSDLVGEYLFTDENFINNLSTEQPNIFKRIYNEIKYFVKQVMPGSQEAKQLEKVKRLFDKAYKLTNENVETDIKFSLVNKNITKKTRIPIVENTNYISVPQKDYNSLKRLKNEVKKVKRSTYENKASGYKADINSDTINKITNPAPKFNPWNNNYIQNLNASVYLPTLFENAVYVDTKSNQKLKNSNKQMQGFHHFVAPIRMNNDVYRVSITAREKVNSNILYIVDAEILQTNKGNTVPNVKNGNIGVLPSDMSVADLVNGVKIYDYNLQQNKVYTDADIQYMKSVDNQGNELTEEQEEYFRESSIRDESGNLMVLYHQTDADFTEFDTHHEGAGSYDYETPYGIYLKPTSNDIGVSGKKQMALYARIKKPFRVENRLELVQKVSQADEAYRELIKKQKEIDREYNAMLESAEKESGNYLTEWMKNNPNRDSRFIYGDPKYQELTEREETITEEWEERSNEVSEQAKARLTQYLQENGYDGLVLETDTGSFGRTTKTIIALESNQVKNIENKNPTDNPNISMSLSNQANKASYSPSQIYGSDLIYDPTLDESPMVEEDLGPVREVTPMTPDDMGPVRDDLATSDGIIDMPDDLPIRDDLAPNPDNFGQPIMNVKDRNAADLETRKVELARMKQLKENVEKEHIRKIAEIQRRLDSKKNKNTKVARELERQIIKEKRLKEEANSLYEQKINALTERINKMNSPEFKVAEQRQYKTEQRRQYIGNLMGDTSTWKDKSVGLQYSVNTLKRNLRDVVRDEHGNRDIAKADAIYDALQGSYNHNEAKLNREANRIRKQFKDLKINKWEDQYIQMLGEYKYNPDTKLTNEVVDKFYQKHKSKIDTAKVDKAIDMARATYDDLFKRVNEVLKAEGMKEIPYREGYFPHFTQEQQGFFGKLLNWKKVDNSIPTDIAGLTEQFKPSKSYQSFAQHRHGDTTDYSVLKGLDSYTQGALDWIYHIGDIQNFRAFENEIRYRHSEAHVQEQIKKIDNDETLDAEQAQALKDGLFAEAKNPLNNLVQNIRTHTNLLAGKKNTMDRNVESETNRQIYSFSKNISSRVTVNMVGASISSALTNFIPITQSWGEVSPRSTLKAMKATLQSIIKDDGTIDKSDFLTNRLKPADTLSKTVGDKVTEKAFIMMSSVDHFTAQTVWRSKYMENIDAGMSENEAIKDADNFAEGVMAGRSRGNMPVLMEAKNPLIKMYTAFQLEVSNQYGYMFKDMPQNMKNKTSGKLIKAYGAMFLGAYAYNALFSQLTGRNAAFDPLRIIEELLRDLGLGGDDEEEGITDAIMDLGGNIVDELPFVGTLTGGGRIPMSSALPYDNVVDMVTGTAEDVKNGNWGNLTKEWLNPFYYLVLPVGGGQIKKTNEGLAMFDDDLPISGSYTNTGNLRYAVEDTPLNRIQAGLFGQWANENAQDYIDNERQTMKSNQIEEFAELHDLGMTQKEYWDYRDGLKELDTLSEKVDYIVDLDFSTEQKNIMVNNLVDRKEEIDVSNYADFSDYEEFDFYLKNPEKHTLSKAIGTFKEYTTYTKALSNLKSDKDASGNSVSGSRKQKVLKYINGLDASYETKIILYKMEYPSDNRYNKEIIEYLNKREEISYKEMETILKELGFKVEPNGTIRW